MNLAPDVDLEDYVSRPDKLSSAEICACPATAQCNICSLSCAPSQPPSARQLVCRQCAGTDTVRGLTRLMMGRLLTRLCLAVILPADCESLSLSLASDTVLTASPRSRRVRVGA